ncbi:MAG: hypothetical protein MJK04_16165 [Psychrosphaera sp.]|nr:hypothetical protein [Psychrosphaera sp.]
MGIIRIIGATADEQVGTKGGVTRGAAARLNQVSEVSTEVLQDSLSQLVTDLGGVLDNIEQQKSYKLKQFSVAVEISAKGGVSLVGKLEAGAKAGITLVFERD